MMLWINQMKSLVMHLHSKKAQSLIVVVMVICNCQMTRTVLKAAMMMILSVKVMDIVKEAEARQGHDDDDTYVANDEYNGCNYDNEYNYDDECDFDEL
ncbi:hypothetical protein PRUPE_8G011600 [Prunus persica]|uniref:Uncharacterized protein n=1 Tax=Prunus persica TaxID=3760 RepID=A0A251MUI7_PRUPE|nr:hypothetical protein PRUPE_8G011600 [Prunus persica]